ncbi:MULTISPECIES: hypothetical protein [Pseudomonas]|uniref:hypothetical protein n=1 Tax=Pseudomonas TaxID=286 RepID=UPI0006491E1B|nr:MULTISPECIES: hypothetical protein [Pseudomonas]OOW02868.1 hypothetical protein MF6394_12105 [Pseudomonas sp. MF6394]
MTRSETYLDSPCQTTLEQIETLFREPLSLRVVAQDSAQGYLDQHLGTGIWRAGLIYIDTPNDSDGTLAYQSLAELEAQAFARIRTGQTGRVRQTLEIERASISRRLARRLFFSVD